MENIKREAEIICIASVIVLMLIPGSMGHENNSLFQTSTIGALMEGVYDGEMTLEDLSAYGDFGLGTVEALDGEMVGLDGQFYQIKSDGKAYLLNDSMKTPFAEVVFFQPEETMTMDGTSNLSELESYLDSKLATLNLFYGVRIDGKFGYVKTRSVPMQEKPYPPLTEAVADQKIFEFHNVEGTVVGFRCPDYAKGVNVPGYHLHFITHDRSAGGHLLDFEIEDASVSVDSISGFQMVLPQSEAFHKADLSDDQDNQETALNKVESNPGK